jgi:GIY-YIG catalytic domain
MKLFYQKNILCRSGIYQIVNIKNNKKYIGSAICFLKRFNSHNKNFKNNKHPNCYLQNVYNNNKNDLFGNIFYTHSTPSENKIPLAKSCACSAIFISPYLSSQ